jgi:hypothetical protein
MHKLPFHGAGMHGQNTRNLNIRLLCPSPYGQDGGTFKNPCPKKQRIRESAPPLWTSTFQATGIKSCRERHANIAAPRLWREMDKIGRRKAAR